MRPLARAAERACVRPGCPAPARATLSFRYGSREVWLEALAGEYRPECYDLCAAHATRTRPPKGWELRDHRPYEERVEGQPPTAPGDLGGERTVALLAAALRPVPADAPDPSSAQEAEARDDGDDPEGSEGSDESGDQGGSGGSGGSDGSDGSVASEPGAAGSLEDSASPVLEPSRGDETAGPEPAHDVPTGPGPTPDRVPRPVPAARERGAPTEGHVSGRDHRARDW